MSDERLVVTPLVRGLMYLRLDDLVAMLDETSVQWTLSRKKSGGHYYAAIYGDGIVKYQSTERKGVSESPKAVLVRVISAFFIGEKRDFHSYETRELPSE